MKLCIYSPAFNPSIGGLERMSEILAMQSARFGHDVEVLTETERKPGVEDVFPFAVTRTRDFRRRVATMRSADAALFMNVSLHGLRAALTAGRPVVLSHHGIYQGRGIRGAALEYVKRQSTRLFPNIAVSHFVARHLPGKAVVIPNAYDSALFRRSEALERTSDLVFCGRLVSDKGGSLCLEAFARASERVDSLSLTMIGDGPDLPDLRRRATELGLAERVKFTGALTGEALVMEMQRHSCIVVPSIWQEPFGIVALEGIACCDTAIVSSRGGLPEAVGDCGLVVEPTIEDVSSAMIDVARARRLGSRLPGQSGEEERMAHLARHDPELVTRQYLRVIEKALTSGAD